MRRTRQSPLPGTGGRIRYGRAAAVRSDAPRVTEGTLPLGFRTIIEPDQMIVHVRVPGEPFPKQRPQHTRAKLYGTGRVINGQIIPGSGDLRLVQPHTYTPQQTEDAEEMWRAILRVRSSLREPCPHPVGTLMFFQTRHSTADYDNLAKLIGDAMNGSILVDDQQITEAHIHLLRKCTEPATDLLVWMTNRRVPGQPT